jgi:hypothetical protein
VCPPLKTKGWWDIDAVVMLETARHRSDKMTDCVDVFLYNAFIALMLSVFLLNLNFSMKKCILCGPLGIATALMPDAVALNKSSSTIIFLKFLIYDL